MSVLSSGRNSVQKLRRIAAVVTLIGFGWFAHAQVGLEITDSEASPKPPAFVEDACTRTRPAFCAPAWRRSLRSRPMIPAEILAETGIRLPPLPEDWRVRDAQVFPSRYGHSVEIAIDAEDLGRVSLFAAQAPAFDVIAPTLARFDKATAVYWQTGPTCLRADRNRQRQGHRAGCAAAVPQTSLIPHRRTYR